MSVVSGLMLLGSLPACYAHGRLTMPQGQAATTGIEGSGGCWSCTEDSYMWYADGKSGYCCETHPVRFNSGTDESFVCRHAEAKNSNGPLQVVAGGTLDLSWDFVATAEHEGDCAVFISYDVGLPRREQKYVKIANLPYCRRQELQIVSIDIPSGLPAGRALLRWDWRAYHLWPSVEWYAQCADVEISSASGRSPSSLNSYSIIDPPIYPQNCREGVGCRDPFEGDGYSQRDRGYITGPACFDGTLNHCDLTAPGTQGYTGQGGDTVAPSPSPSPAPAPTSSPSSSRPPAPSSSPSVCNKEKYAQCGGSGFTGDTCCPKDMWCMYDNQWWSQCEPCSETSSDACETSTNSPATTTTTTAAYSPSSSRPPASSSSPSVCNKEKYAQCGGSGFTGDTCCPKDMWCMYANQWWSQCEPCSETPSDACETSTNSPATTTTTTAASTSPISPPGADRFEPVDGGSGRACRGATPSDNDASYYSVFFGVSSLDDCKAKCLSDAMCRGIEHDGGSGRCEVWTRPAGIQASLPSAGYTCLAVSGTCFKDSYAQCGGEGFSGDTCCPAGMWCMTIAACDDPSKWMARCEPCTQTWDAASCSASLAQKSSKRKIRVRKADLGTAWMQVNMSRTDVQKWSDLLEL